MEQAPGLADKRVALASGWCSATCHARPALAGTIALDTGLTSDRLDSRDRADGTRPAGRARPSTPGTVRPARPGGGALVVEASSPWASRSTSTTLASAIDLAAEERHKGSSPRDNRRVERWTRCSTAFGRWPSRRCAAVEGAQGLRPIGATVALPGLVDTDRGLLLMAPNLSWEDVPVVDSCATGSRSVGLPADIGQRGEPGGPGRGEGAATGMSDFVYVWARSGWARDHLGRELYRG